MFGFVWEHTYQELVRKYITVKDQNTELSKANAELTARIRGFHRQLAETERGYLEQIEGLNVANVELRRDLDAANAQVTSLSLQLTEALKPRKRTRGQPVISGQSD